MIFAIIKTPLPFAMLHINFCNYFLSITFITSVVISCSFLSFLNYLSQYVIDWLSRSMGNNGLSFAGINIHDGIFCTNIFTINKYDNIMRCNVCYVTYSGCID